MADQTSTRTDSRHGFLWSGPCPPPESRAASHPRIFSLALELMQVRAAESAMVGDSLTHDVASARRAGMRGILLSRNGHAGPVAPEVTVIQSLSELLEVL
jgi:FMN phosphatase YigB (HAD superfamily)